MQLLPRIVVKSPEVETTIISRFKNESLDPADIARLWKVFSTVKQKTVDPTAQASRLENFLWRVWGSKQINLPGIILGDLFCKISDESSYEGLRRSLGCLNESHEYETQKISHNSGLSQEKTLDLVNTGPSKTKSSNKLNVTSVTPHPILKKTRGPSSNGPRPTARFISPHETEDEQPAIHGSTVALQQAPIDTGDIKLERKHIPGPTIPKKKGKTVPVKKKQPIILRRQSSHSSTETVSKTLMHSRAGSKVSSTSDRTSSASTRQRLGRTNSQVLENPSNVSEKQVGKVLTSLKSKPSGLAKTKPASKSSIDSSFITGKNLVLVPKERNLESDQNVVLCDQTKEVSRTCTDTSVNVEHQGLELASRQVQLESKKHLHSHKNSYPFFSTETAHEDTNPAPSTRSKTGMIKKQESLYNIDVTDRGIDPGKSDESKLHTEESLIPFNLFAKKPIQFTFSTPKSAENLSRSKSQLTMLVERDLARLGSSSSKKGK